MSSQPMATQNKLPAVIDRLEGEWAVLRLGDNQELRWPKDKISNAREGQEVVLLLQSEPESEESRQRLAKEILNEILNPTENVK